MKPPRAQGRLATATSANEDGPRTYTPRKAKLRYEIHGRAFPLPLVTGTIAGQPALMLVDTGANSHVIAGWFARKLGLPMKKLGDVGTDHVGKTIATFRIEKPEIAIDDWGALTPVPVLATDVPEVIEKLGIGAFISPQRLVEEGDSVVLDLAKGELRPAWWDEAHYELSATGLPLVIAEPRACEETEGPIKGLAYVLPRRSSPSVSSSCSTPARSTPTCSRPRSPVRSSPAQSTVNKEPMYTASGKISARKLKGAHLNAGSFCVTHGRRPHRRRRRLVVPARRRARDGLPPLVHAPPRPLARLRALRAAAGACRAREVTPSVTYFASCATAAAGGADDLLDRAPRLRATCRGADRRARGSSARCRRA